MLPFYTKYLSVDEYGISDLLMIYVSLLLAVITCSITEAIFVFPKGQDELKQKQYFSSGIAFSFVSLIIGLLLFYLSKEFCLYFKFSNTFTNYTWIIYLMVVSSFFQQFFQQFSRSIDKIKVYAFSGVVLTASIATFSFILIPKFRLMGFIYALVLANFTTAFFTFFLSGSYRFFVLNGLKKKIVQEMLVYAIPLVPNVIMWWLISAINRPIMEHYLDLHAVGIFAVANKFPAILNMVFGVFATSWQISVIEEFYKNGYTDFYNKILRVLFFVLTLCSCTFAIFSKYMVIFMVDEKFIESWKYIPILTIAILFSSLSGFVGTNFLAVKKSKYYFYSSIWGAISGVCLNFLLIPLWGLFGAAMSIVIAHGVMSFSRILYSWKYVQIKNIHIYIIMLIINVFVIITMFYISNIYYKSVVVVVLFTCFISINFSLIQDFKLLLQNFISKVIKKRYN